MSVFAQEAERLLLLGYHLFQCLPKSKDPFAGPGGTAPNGCNSASGDLETIRRWWTNHPDCNIGLKCDNLLVIDVDNKNGKNGNADFSKVMDRLGPVTTGPVSQSGNYGYHLFFRKPGVDIKSAKGVKWEGKKTGIDIQVGNQYIVMPPSIHPVTGLAYQWKSPPCSVDELPALPDAWIEHFLPHRTPKTIIVPDKPKLILPPSCYGSSPVDRCREYLTRVDPCIAGPRRTQF